MQDQIVVFLIPVFGIAILAEFVFGRLRQKNNYQFDQTLSNLSQAILSQSVSLCTAFLQFGVYHFFNLNFSLVQNPSFWLSWSGWILAFLIYDFSDYWLHRCSHRTAILWAAHVVHHQSTSLNYSAALRLESFYSAIGFVFFLPMAMIGIPLEQFITLYVVVLVYQFWIHTEHIGKLGWFDRIFSSPSNHRVHHAKNPEYIDKNYGAVLIIWDRWFGTFKEETVPCIYGTDTSSPSQGPISAVTSLFAELAIQIVHAHGFVGKVRVVLGTPEIFVKKRLGMLSPMRVESKPDFEISFKVVSMVTTLMLLAVSIIAGLSYFAETLSFARQLFGLLVISALLTIAHAITRLHLVTKT